MTTEYINALRVHRRPPTASELLHQNIDRNPLLVGVQSEVALIDSGAADLAVVRQATLYGHISGFAKHAPGSLSPRHYRARSPETKREAAGHGERSVADDEEGQHMLRFRRPDLPSLESLCIASINTTELEYPSLLLPRPLTAPSTQRRIHSAPARAGGAAAVSALLKRKPFAETTARKVAPRAQQDFSVQGTRPVSAMATERDENSRKESTAATPRPTAIKSRTRGASAPPIRVMHPVTATAMASARPTTARKARAWSAKPVVRDEDVYDPPLSQVLFVSGSLRNPSKTPCENQSRTKILPADSKS
ncbi:hypothetical protein HDU86_000266 [Geranomyces michiganensis]|nr:hypothetical protein HDU86_000266 [Geranomyces michiganensis]